MQKNPDADTVSEENYRQTAKTFSAQKRVSWIRISAVRNLNMTLLKGCLKRISRFYLSFLPKISVFDR